MAKKKKIDDLIEEITTDAYDFDEQLWEFFNAFEENLGEPVAAHVLGEPVQVDCYQRRGERRGLTAICLKDGETWEISLLDVEFPAGTREADLVDALRKFIGAEPLRRRRPTKKTPKKKQKASVQEIDVGEPVDVAILAVKKNATRLRILSTGREITLRAALRAVPGEIATVVPKKIWSFNKHPYMSADEVTDIRLDVPALGLTPLKLEDFGPWEPEEHYWGEEDEPLEDWAKPIHAAGPRPMFILEDIVPGDELYVVEDGVKMFTDGPILGAIAAWNEGDAEGAYKILDDLLIRDLRCLDAHAHLANFIFDHNPGGALRHYSVALQIAKLTLGEDFNGVLPWGRVENRPFFRCLHGYGLCLWRLGRPGEAQAVFERMLWLNPTDNQGARFLLADVKAGRSWEEFVEAERAGCPF